MVIIIITKKMYRHAFDMLTEGLFHRMITRAIRWSQENRGREAKLYFRRGRFYLDSEHDFVLEMAPQYLARVKVCGLSVNNLKSSVTSIIKKIKGHCLIYIPTYCATHLFLRLYVLELSLKWLLASGLDFFITHAKNALTGIY